MNSLRSRSGNFMRPPFQSALACSMRSLDDDTKFHSMKRSPTGSPPSSMTMAGTTAVKTTGGPGLNTGICPWLKTCPSTSIEPATT
jgi:hypothetical protein